ncbi:MAG: pyridoxal phosphate-dependent aminotransferase [Candidatus Omnitrophota bacterium]
MKLNRRIQEILPSSTLAITARAKELKAEGRDVVNFAGGEPDFDTPEAIKQAAVQAIQNGQTKYTPSIGTLEIRKEISRKFQDDNGLSYAPDQIAVNCGAKHSVFAAVQVLADEGDEVIIPSPYWVSYPEMVKFSGAVPKVIPTGASSHFKITPQQLEEAVTDRTKVLILNSPSNPTGMVYTRDELAAIAEVCVKHDIFVISDEIYEKLIYDGLEFVSFASLGQEAYDRTITVNGVSKAYAMTGWRIGYMAGPKEVMTYVKRLQDHSTSNPCSISQAAALAALRSPADDLQAMAAEFNARRDLLMSLIDEVDDLSYIRPQGAFYLFCDVSKLGDSFKTAQAILNDVNVAMIPGEGFGAPGYVRISFATSQERIREGIRRIAGWIQQQKA